MDASYRHQTRGYVVLTKAPARQIFRDLLALLDAFATNGNACLGP